MNRFIQFSLIQFYKTFMVLAIAPYYKILVLTQNAGAWNCIKGLVGCQYGPYSPQWYSFYQMIGIFGYVPEMLILCLIDSVIVLTIARVESSRFTMMVAGSSFLFVYLDPGDALIFWLAMLSRAHWFLSITAALTKFPIGGPLYIWLYIGHVPLSTEALGYLWNPTRYGIITLWALQPLIRRFRK